MLFVSNLNWLSNVCNDFWRQTENPSLGGNFIFDKKGPDGLTANLTVTVIKGNSKFSNLFVNLLTSLNNLSVNSLQTIT